MSPGKKPRIRGQVATENLILYAVVVLIVLLMLIGIWQSGVLKPFLGKRNYIGFSQIVPTDWVVSRSERVYLNLKSEADAPLRIEKFWINTTFPHLECELGPADPQTFEPRNLTLQPGKKYIIAIKCPGLAEEYELGEEYEMDIAIDYTNLVSKQIHVSSGKIYGLMEMIEGPWIPTSVTETTSTTILQCFYHECNLSGQFDDPNCGDILYPRYERLCMYCPENADFFPDGIRRCWYKGHCGETCGSRRDCAPDEYLNLCTECVNNVCKERPDRPPCGPCPPYDAGKRGSTWCNATRCDYCTRQWVKRSDLNCEGYYEYKCVDEPKCGQLCAYVGFDDYKVCERRCPHCLLVNEETKEGMCTQGSCGDICRSDEDCISAGGCPYCNRTTCSCELGDCGKPCGFANPSQVCEVGCDTCFDDVCVKTDIGVNILAHNGTGGKIVRANQMIFLDVSGKSIDGIEKLIVSNGTKLPPGYADCKALTDERNGQGQITDPYNDPWIDDHVVWIGEYTCSGHPETCTNRWITDENEVGRYCYFAMAQKYAATGEGKWSSIVADYMQVGEMAVYLIAPRPNV